MDITAKRADLAREMGLARRLSERKTTIPIYGFALLTANSDGLELTATDGEEGLVSRCVATVAEQGALLVPVRTFHEMVKAASCEDVRLYGASGKVHVVAGGFQSSLQTLNPDDFPSMPAPPETAAILPAPAIRSAIAKVKFVIDSATVNPTNYCMHGALLELGEESVRMVTTDGYRLAHFQAPCAGANQESIILPRKTLDGLQALLSESDAQEVLYAKDATRAYLTVGDRMIISRVIDGEFPNYKRIIPPESNEHRVLVNREDWLGALKRVMLVATQLVSRVRIVVEDGLMTASLAAADVGEAAEPTPIELTGEGWESGFEIKYLADFLSAADTPTITLEQRSPNAGAALRSFAGEHKYTYVQMPMAKV